MTTGIRIVGLDEIEQKLGIDLKPAIQGASMIIASEIQDRVSPYPPSSSANSPSQRRWYERLWGQRWRRRDGSMGGRATSERLKERWGIKKHGSTGAELGNLASYAPFVHSADKQARFHKRRGWKTDEWAIRRVVDSGKVQKIINQAIRHRLDWK